MESMTSWQQKKAGKQLAGGLWVSSCWWQKVEGELKQDIEMSKNRAHTGFL